MLVGLVLSAALLAPADEWRESLQRMAAAEVLCGEFEQLRVLPQLERPLRSTGRFIASRSRGLVWVQEAPFDLVLVVDDSRLTQQVKQQSPVTITAEEQPEIFYFTRVLLQVFGGDDARLAEHFEISPGAGGDGWSVVLLPKSELLGKVFQGLTLAGTAFLESLDIKDGAGGSLLIRLKGITECTGTLSDADQHLFELR